MISASACLNLELSYTVVLDSLHSYGIGYLNIEFKTAFMGSPTTSLSYQPNSFSSTSRIPFKET